MSSFEYVVNTSLFRDKAATIRASLKKLRHISSEIKLPPLYAKVVLPRNWCINKPPHGPQIILVLHLLGLCFGCLGFLPLYAYDKTPFSIPIVMSSCECVVNTSLFRDKTTTIQASLYCIASYSVFPFHSLIEFRFSCTNVLPAKYLCMFPFYIVAFISFSK